MEKNPRQNQTERKQVQSFFKRSLYQKEYRDEKDEVGRRQVEVNKEVG